MFHKKTIGAVLCALGMSFALGAAPASESNFKTPIVDGSVVHDAGEMLLNITNVGLIGSWPGSSAFGGAPSARWPGAGGDDLLFGAGLWVGAIVNGERLVSTGQFQIEFYPTDDPLDVIYTMARGDANGARYPNPAFDDDLDGQEDEDPKNAIDDDFDGLIDEDFGIIGDQHFRTVYSDLNPIPGQTDHMPLGLEVVQESYQWMQSDYDDFVGFEFTIRNVGNDLLEDVYLGFFADFDIPAGVASGAEDDLPWYFEGDVTAPSGAAVPVTVASMYDADGQSPGAAGVVLLGHDTDASGQTAPPNVSVRSFQALLGTSPFEQGGDATNDSERYDLLSRDEKDVVPALNEEGRAGDYRTLISSGPFPSLAPGEELTYQVALVAGVGVDGVIHNAAAATEVYLGGAFDRDGDPSTGPDGNETIVRWLLPQEIPVPVAAGALRSRRDGQRAVVDVEARYAALDGLVLRREDAAGVTASWWVRELPSAIASDHGIEARLEDWGVTVWPATYELVQQSGAGSMTLAIEVVGSSDIGALQLRIRPNPVRGDSRVIFSLPRAADARLEIYDLRGRLVRSLVSGLQAAGTTILTWNGTDARGRAVASGTYFIQLMADDRIVKRPIVVVK